jgi:hypothetical protein
MADQHSEVIIAAIMTALEGISEASGYRTTPQIVQRYSRTALEKKERPCLTVMRSSEGKAPRGTGEADTVNCDLTLEIEGICAPIDDESELPADRAMADLQDDVEKALFTEVDWEDLQVLEEPRLFTTWFGDPENPEDGFTMSVTIRYAHEIGDSSNPLAPEP